MGVREYVGPCLCRICYSCLMNEVWPYKMVTIRLFNTLDVSAYIHVHVNDIHMKCMHVYDSVCVDMFA